MSARTGRRNAAPRSILDSPWLAAAIVAVVLGVVAAILTTSGLFGPGGPTASATPPPTTPPTPTAAPIATFVRPTPSPPPTFTTYVVRSGDTLSSIAKKFQTTARSIAWWNRGAYPSLDPESAHYDPNTVRLGWRLVVLPGTVVDENNPPTPSPGPTPRGTPAAN
jgi:hypothetical protein